MKVRSFKEVVQQFHNDEDGIEALQVVMIIAIAAMVIIAVFAIGDDILQWARDAYEKMTKKKSIG